MKYLTPSRLILAFLLLLLLVIRFIPGAGEVYATVVYPYTSAGLSWISSFIQISLDEIVALLGILLLIVSIVQGVRQHRGGLHTTLRTAEILCWYYVWFQFGWGINYFRDDFYTRMSVAPAQAEKEAFMEFATDYAEQLNASWVEIKEKDKDEIVSEIKSLYHRHLPPTSGLCQPQAYQQPKEMLLNRLYSASGVLGFMGPWMGENLLNANLLPVQFPSVYAHELSHLLGITSEAEANYWSYYICTRASSPEIRYSGYQSLLPYVLSNALMLLSEEEYRDYFMSIREEVMQDRRAISAHWQAQHIGFVDEFQNFLLNLQLKSHGIPSGTQNYNQVVQMIMSMRIRKSEKVLDRPITDVEVVTVTLAPHSFRAFKIN